MENIQNNNLTNLNCNTFTTHFIQDSLYFKQLDDDEMWDEDYDDYEDDEDEYEDEEDLEEGLDYDEDFYDNSESFEPHLKCCVNSSNEKPCPMCLAAGVVTITN